MFSGCFCGLGNSPKFAVKKHIINIRVTGGGKNPAAFPFGGLAVAGYVFAVVYCDFGHGRCSLLRFDDYLSQICDEPASLK